MADIVEDENTLETARYEAANALLEEDFQSNSEYGVLRELVGIEDGQISDILD